MQHRKTITKNGLKFTIIVTLVSAYGRIDWGEMVTNNNGNIEPSLEPFTNEILAAKLELWEMIKPK